MVGFSAPVGMNGMGRQVNNQCLELDRLNLFPVPATSTPTSALHAHQRKNGQEPGYAKWLTPVSLFNVSLSTELLDGAALALRPLSSIPLPLLW